MAKRKKRFTKSSDSDKELTPGCPWSKIPVAALIPPRQLAHKAESSEKSISREAGRILHLLPNTYVEEVNAWIPLVSVHGWLSQVIQTGSCGRGPCFGAALYKLEGQSEYGMELMHGQNISRDNTLHVDSKAIIEERLRLASRGISNGDQSWSLAGICAFSKPFFVEYSDSDFAKWRKEDDEDDKARKATLKSKALGKSPVKDGKSNLRSVIDEALSLVAAVEHDKVRPKEEEEPAAKTPTKQEKTLAERRARKEAKAAKRETKPEAKEEGDPAWMTPEGKKTREAAAAAQAAAQAQRDADSLLRWNDQAEYARVMAARQTEAEKLALALAPPTQWDPSDCVTVQTPEQAEEAVRQLEREKLEKQAEEAKQAAAKVASEKALALLKKAEVAAIVARAEADLIRVQGGLQTLAALASKYPEDKAADKAQALAKGREYADTAVQGVADAKMWATRATLSIVDAETIEDAGNTKLAADDVLLVADLFAELVKAAGKVVHIKLTGRLASTSQMPQPGVKLTIKRSTPGTPDSK